MCPAAPICGSLGISQACGKVESVEVDEANQCYKLTMEGDALHGYGGFEAGDYVRCQRYTLSGVRGYWVQVGAVEQGGKVVCIPFSEFEGKTIKTQGCTDESGLKYDADQVIESDRLYTDDELLTDADGNHIVNAYGLILTSRSASDEADAEQAGSEELGVGSYAETGETAEAVAEETLSTQSLSADATPNSTLQTSNSIDTGYTIAYTLHDADGNTLTTDDAETALVTATTDYAMIAPVKGDDLVQYGSATNERRRTAVFIHASEDGAPAVDILMNITGKTFAGCLSVRLGGDLPGTDQGVGLYAKNGHILAVKDNGTVIYQFKPDGAFSLGNGKIVYDPETDRITLTGVTLSWADITDTADLTDSISKAQETADKAQTAASDAQSTADDAQSTADKAQSAADKAQETANDANGHAQDNYESIRDLNTAIEGKADKADIPTIPAFVTDWNTNATQISGTAIATPQAAIGTKDAAGKFTGIVMGSQTEGEGYQLAAYDKDEAKVVIDPVTGKYLFSGKLVSTEGEIGGFTINGDYLGTTVTDPGQSDPEETTGTAYISSDGVAKFAGKAVVSITPSADPDNGGNVLSVYGGETYLCGHGYWNGKAYDYTDRSADGYGIEPTYHALTAYGNVHIDAPFIRLTRKIKASPYYGAPQIMGFARRITDVSEDTVLDYYHDIVKCNADIALTFRQRADNAPYQNKEYTIIGIGHAIKIKSSYGAYLYVDGATDGVAEATFTNRILHIIHSGYLTYIK